VHVPSHQASFRRRARPWILFSARSDKAGLFAGSPLHGDSTKDGNLFHQAVLPEMPTGYWQHEYGHVLGLDEAYGPGGPYQDYYCVMSEATTPLKSTETMFGVTSPSGPAVNGVYCERLSGIPARRIVDLDGDRFSLIVMMAPLGHADQDGALLARVRPMPGRDNTYWLEYRHPSGWDVGIGQASAVVHMTKPNDGRSYLADGPNYRAMRRIGDEVIPPESSFVFRLVRVSADRLQAEVRIWELGPGNLRTVRIRQLVASGPGNDLDFERVVIRNDQKEAVNLNGWTLSDASTHNAGRPTIFYFPAFMLEPGTDVTVWTRAGQNDEQNLFWGRRSPVWNNVGGDAAILMNPQRAEVDRFEYP
jgi:Lamin Tail Domain